MIRPYSLLLALLLTCSAALATTPRDVRIDNLGNLSGGSLIAVPSSGTSYCTDSNTITLTSKTMSGASNTFSAIPESAISTSTPFPVSLLTTSPTSLTESSNAVTIDWSTSNTFSLTLNGNLNTVTFSNTTSGQTIVVAITNTASNYSVTWGNSIKWVGGTQPTQTVGAHTDVWTLIDLGGTYYGNAVQNF